jgi:hypothetical protein
MMMKVPRTAGKMILVALTLNGTRILVILWSNISTTIATLARKI